MQRKLVLNYCKIGHFTVWDVHIDIVLSYNNINSLIKLMISVGYMNLFRIIIQIVVKQDSV